MTPRVRDWRSRLQAWEHRRLGEAFRWGHTDCCALAREALREMFGREALEFIPAWESLQRGYRILQEHEEIGKILERIGAVPTTLPFLRAGDIVVAPSEEEMVAVAVCVDARRCISSTVKGGVIALQMGLHVPLAQVYSVWELQ